MKTTLETDSGRGEPASLAALLDVLDDGVLWLDADQRVVFCNRAYRRLWGYGDAETLLGLAHEALIGRTAAALVDAAGYRAHVRDVARSTEPGAACDLYLNDGRQLRVTTKPLAGSDGGGRAWLFESVIERQALSENDSLTGLYNRHRFTIELSRLLAGAARHGRQMGVVLIDVDAFVPFSERYGQDAGNEVLVTMARAVGAVIRRDELFFRLGGDEFAILVPDVCEEEIAGLARRLRQQVDRLSFEFGGEGGEGGELVTISASFGVALYPLHALNADDLLQCARAAVLAVKEHGTRGWGFYEPPKPAL